MTSTIQLSEKTKSELKLLRKEGSYEDIIKGLIKEHVRHKVAEDMKEYGQKYGEEEAVEVEEWHHTSPRWE